MALINRPTCPSCGSQEIWRVTMTLAGAPTHFSSCPSCEWKGWEREGQGVPLGSVLTLVASR